MRESGGVACRECLALLIAGRADESQSGESIQCAHPENIKRFNLDFVCLVSGLNTQEDSTPSCFDPHI